jgi:hypothetical protein
MTLLFEVTGGKFYAREWFLLFCNLGERGTLFSLSG